MEPNVDIYEQQLNEAIEVIKNYFSGEKDPLYVGPFCKCLIEKINVKILVFPAGKDYKEYIYKEIILKPNDLKKDIIKLYLDITNKGLDTSFLELLMFTRFVMGTLDWREMFYPNFPLVFATWW